jgi:7-keto-8-aminopelargonate synthetase-like enzyme
LLVLLSGPDWAIDFLIQRSRPFIFPPPAARLLPLEASLDVIRDESESGCSRAKSDCFAGFLASPDWISRLNSRLSRDPWRQPARLSAAEELQREGFDVRALRPPTVLPARRVCVLPSTRAEESTLRNLHGPQKVCSTVHNRNGYQRRKDCGCCGFMHRYCATRCYWKPFKLESSG